ncbi:MAG: hypothetical protein QM627_00490 [Luteolibacter sp.]
MQSSSISASSSVSGNSPVDRLWLVRLADVFSPEARWIFGEAGVRLSRELSGGYFIVHAPDGWHLRAAEAGVFLRWGMRVDHGWPCNPQKMEGFIEKAAQALARKFSSLRPQAVLVGALDPANRYYKTLASNLRGRALQVFGDENIGRGGVEEQDPSRPTLFCLVGKEGLFCGCVPPREANGFFPGGTKFIRQNAPGTISRAGAKVAEALHYLPLVKSVRWLEGNGDASSKAHWLELGACPGGMTSELLERGFRVTAVDRAPLDKRLDGAAGLKFFLGDVREFRPAAGERYQALLCDMNGDPLEAFRQVLRLSGHLETGGVVIFTLKSTGAEDCREILKLLGEVLAIAADGGLECLVKTHLTYNRYELTLIFEKIEGVEIRRAARNRSPKDPVGKDE